ncbi:uncharacterized protein EMH_0061900 [Eimeria mitis]|uniref:Uncharacterized protein n=1 Tax=Eimeria mitis TaxID=44415 RepID=U6KE69_9EIME|nr:uncharacterized protein EMH_0061900 [Eimeria mitis]CDJ36244.1 hypothetical protein, conserved [Eimeria mitis]
MPQKSKSETGCRELCSWETDQAQVQDLAPSYVRRALKQLQHSGELKFLRWGSDQPEKQKLQQQQHRKQQPDHSEEQHEQWKRTQHHLNDTQRRRLRTQLCGREGVCGRKGDYGEICDCGIRRSRYTSNYTNGVNRDNCKCHNSAGECSGNCKVNGRKNGEEPVGQVHDASRDAVVGVPASEAQAAEAAVEAQRAAASVPPAAALQVRAMQLLKKLSPFPEGSGFVPSALPQLHYKQRNLPEEAGSPSAANATIYTADGSAVSGRDDDKNELTATRIVQGEGIEEEKAQQKQREILELELLERQAFANVTTAAAPLHEDNEVLLPKMFENLLLQGPWIRQQQPAPAEQQQTVHVLQRGHQYAAQAQQSQQQIGYLRQNDELLHPSKCIQGNSRSSNSNSCRNSNNSSNTGGCFHAHAVVPVCSVHSNCDSRSRSKRRPGNIIDWQQTAALLHSLIAAEDLPEQLQHHHSAVPDATHALKGATCQWEGTANEAVSTNSLAAHSSETAGKVLPGSVGSAFAASGATAAPILLQQQNAEPHLHQSLPAEVAQQILRRIISATVELHRHHKGDHAPHQHNQQQNDHLQQERKDLEQALQHEQQEEHQVQGRYSGPAATCCCSVSSCRSFCAFLLHLLRDFRAQQKQHERLYLLLLQLLLQLLQQQLACATCRCDSGFLRQYLAFVVEQMEQLQQQQEEGKGLTPDLLLVDFDSLHHQKRLVLLLQLALLLRAWRASGGTSRRKVVVKVAYLSLIHLGACVELREAAADILAAAALDELSTAVQEAAVEATSTQAAWFTYAEAAATADSATTAARAAAVGMEASKEAGAAALCSSITKAAVEGSSAAAAAAAELASSVACCFLLILQQDTQHSVTAGSSPTAGLTVGPRIREFSAETAAAAFPMLLLLLLPGLEHQLLKGETLRGTAATPFSLSLHAAEALHILRIAILRAQQHPAWQPQHELQIVHQFRQRCMKMVLTLQQQQLLRLLEQQLMRLLSVSIRTCIEQFDLSLPLLQRELPGRSKTSRSSRSSGTGWSIVEAAVSAIEAPLCCVCVLVQLPRLGLAAPADCAGQAETLEEVVATLVNLLLRLMDPCGCFTRARAPAAGEAAETAERRAPATAPALALTAATFGCFSKLLVALTEAARSTCMQIQQLSATATTPNISEETAVAAGELQQCFARGAAAVVRLCLDSAAAGQALQQQEQLSDFIAAVADADVALSRFFAVHREHQQLQRPVALQLLEQILQAPISDRRQGSNSCGVQNSETTFSGRKKGPIAAATGARRGADAMLLTYVSVEASATAALKVLARFLENRKAASALPTTATSAASAAVSSDTAASNDATDTAAASSGAAVRLLRIAWTRLVGPALRETCFPHSAPEAVTPAVATATKAERSPTAAAATVAATAACVQAGQQHALAIIETRGSLISAFASAMAAAAPTETATAVEPKVQQPVRHELQQLHDLQQDFTMVAVAVSSLRPLALELFLWPLRYLVAQQQKEPQQQRKHQPQRQLVQIWRTLYSCFCAEDEAPAAGATSRRSSSNGCCCCRLVTLDDFLQQDDWVHVSDLLLELLQLLQKTSPSASTGSSGERSCLAAAAAVVERAAASERAYQRPPQTQGDCQFIFFPSKGLGPCSSTEHPECIQE